MRFYGFPVVLLLSLLANITGTLSALLGISKPTFTVDYNNNELLMDGKFFRFVSGSLHYFRIPKAFWKDRIQKMKAAGLNAVSTYVEWSLHEPYSGVYNFDDMADLEYFIELIQDEGMYVLLRPGPYICAERDFGGFPYWLLNVVPKKRLRTNDPKFKKYVTQWFDVLMPKIKPYLYGNGGNIIMVQVENEYGSYDACDREYMKWLRDLYRSYVGFKALLYTTDGCGYSYFTCGAIPGVYATVDFGVHSNVSECFNYMRKTQPKGPLINSEFYPGWLSHWGEPNSKVKSELVVRKMKEMMAMNASYNFYMFHGGTNFGFTSGANTNKNSPNFGFQPQLTSYDYDAPLDEAGDPTEKYYMIKQTLEKANFGLSNEILPVIRPKGDYGKFTLYPVASLFEKITQRYRPITSDIPLGFEDLDVNTGFVLYETILTDEQKALMSPTMNLTLKTVRDRAIIYLDQEKVGIMSRFNGNTTMQLNINSKVEKLSILVENLGRINYGSFLEDRKGIFDPVKLDNLTLGPWKMIAYPLNETSWVSTIQPTQHAQLPAYFKTEFVLPESNAKCLDTWLDPSGWTKGVAFLNGINLGRYWPVVGPQITLFVPSVFLVPPPATNTLIMVELEEASPDLSVRFIDYHKLNGSITD
ncbi:beta-galactosidase-like [Daktulosphaira vitifoliae]|uniref:beta-galactosidase-like n=1 Tax=Daktulosphaira vitifoliae TaxID=58002 RepID=UPI0021A98844|nr:beta-galactosidase-like [Daktulosphaira vitifoliae]